MIYQNCGKSLTTVYIPTNRVDTGGGGDGDGGGGDGVVVGD